MVFTWLNLAIVAGLAMGLAFASAPLVGALLFSPSSRGGSHAEPYECGMPPQGSGWTRFGINYYVYALLFLAFDVDVLYLFPVAVWYPESDSWLSFVKVLIFLLVLALGCVYFWRKGVFEWPRKIATKEK